MDFYVLIKKYQRKKQVHLDDDDLDFDDITYTGEEIDPTNEKTFYNTWMTTDAKSGYMLFGEGVECQGALLQD